MNIHKYLDEALNEAALSVTQAYTEVQERYLEGQITALCRLQRGIKSGLVTFDEPLDKPTEKD